MHNNVFTTTHYVRPYSWQSTHSHLHAKPGSEVKKNSIGIKSQIAILTLTEASASGKIKDRTGCGSKIHHRRMSSYAVSWQRTAWHRWAFLPTEIWAKLYNPLHPKVQAFICWLPNCGVVQSLNMSSPCCYCDAFFDNLQKRDSRARA